MNEYNTEVSKHYAAYRPPIHKQILQEALSQVETGRFVHGLDIGSGTGRSTKALSDFCIDVVGIEPSEDMLAQAESNQNISFIQTTGEQIPLPSHTIDIVTFAGSLYYAKSAALVTELVRVCDNTAIIVCYDFNVQLAEFMSRLGAKIQANESSYNHAENFDGYQELMELKVHRGSLTLNMTSEQLAHVLFSSMTYYLALVERFGDKDTFPLVIDALGKSEVHPVIVDTFYSTYQINKS